MRGTKKKSLAQIEQQAQHGTHKKLEPTNDKKSKGKSISENRTTDISMPNLDDKFMGEFSKIDTMTPYSIATQFKVQLSVARNIMEELEKRRFVRPEGGNARIKICRLAAA